MPKDMRKDLVMYTKPADTRSSTRMRFQLILIFMNTKVAKSYGVLTKSAKNMQLKKSDVSRQLISKTNYLKTNLLKQIKKISLNGFLHCIFFTFAKLVNSH